MASFSQGGSDRARATVGRVLRESKQPQQPPQQQNHAPAAKLVRKAGPVVARAAFSLVGPSTTAAPRTHAAGQRQSHGDDDELWVDKQERAFTAWINAQMDAATRVPAHVPSPFDVPESVVNAARATAQAMMAKLEPEIAGKRIVIRDDLDYVVDLAVRDHIIQMVLAFHPAWLMLGMGAVFGPQATGLRTSDRLTLATLVNTHLLTVEHGEMENGVKVVGPPKHPVRYAQYRVALQEHILRRFLPLVLFLDKAKSVRLLAANPLLFQKTAPWKSTREILVAFAQRHLKGEGDLVRHLAYMGYAVAAVQTALEELDYRVTNLAVDLRDGARLARLVEHLAHDTAISTVGRGAHRRRTDAINPQELRYPAATRAACIGNVRLVMQALARHGLALGEVRAGLLTPEDIADGHREKTLGLLWKIILHWQVDTLLNEETLKREIACLRRDVARRRRDGALANGPDSVDLDQQLDSALVSYFQSPKLSLLLQWCQSVCALVDVPVQNFSSSFSDGRALCYLINYYNPALLPLSAIRTVTSRAPAPPVEAEEVVDENVANGRVVRAVALTFSPGNRPGVLTAAKIALNNELANFREVQKAISAMGGVPFHLEATDLSGGLPDEKSVITLVSYLCARMLSQRNEIRAAKTIQLVWREARVIKKATTRKVAPALTVKSAPAPAPAPAPVPVLAPPRKPVPTRTRAQIEEATNVLQAAYRGVRARREFRVMRAAIVLQRWWRLKVVAVRQHALEAQEAARIEAERIARMETERIEAARAETARIEAAKIEAERIEAERVEAERIEAERTEAKRVEAARIEAERIETERIEAERVEAARIEAQRIEAERTHAAAVAIQAAFRGYAARQQYSAVRSAVCVIQVHVRAILAGRRQRAAWLAKCKATVTLQRTWRAVVAGRAVRAQVGRMRAAAIAIQTRWRALVAGRRARASWLATRSACVVLQQRWRAVTVGARVRADLARHRAAVLTIQRLFREYRVLHAVRRERLIATRRERAAVRIQTAVRSFLARLHYATARSAAVQIQSVWRGWRVRRMGSKQVDAVRARVKQANARFTEAMTLGSRTTAALEILLSSKSLSHVMKACYHLEVSTRLSPSCCVRLADHHAIPILLFLIRSCNRSQPHMEVLRLALNVLRNLAMCPQTVNKAFEAEDGVEVLSELMQIYRDSTDIFVRSLQVLAILASDAGRLQVLKAKNAKEVARLKTVVALIEQRYAPAAGAVQPGRAAGRATLGGHGVTATSAAAARESAARSAELLAAAVQLKSLLATPRA